MEACQKLRPALVVIDLDAVNSANDELGACIRSDDCARNALIAAMSVSARTFRRLQARGVPFDLEILKTSEQRVWHEVAGFLKQRYH